MEESLDDLIARTFPFQASGKSMFYAPSLRRFVRFDVLPDRLRDRTYRRIHGIAAAQTYLARKRKARVTRAFVRDMAMIAALFLLAGYIAG